MQDPRRVDTWGRLALAAVFTVFALLVIHMAVRPMYAARRDLTAFREAVEILSDAEGNLDRLDDEIQRITKEVEQSHAQLPRRVNLDAFLEWLGEIAKATTVRVEQLLPGEVDEYPLFRRQSIQLRITGSFPAVYDFLIRLEEVDQLSRVETLELVGSREDRVCAAEMGIALYFAPQEEGS